MDVDLLGMDDETVIRDDDRGPTADVDLAFLKADIRPSD